METTASPTRKSIPQGIHDAGLLVLCDQPMLAGPVYRWRQRASEVLKNHARFRDRPTSNDEQAQTGSVVAYRGPGDHAYIKRRAEFL